MEGRGINDWTKQDAGTGAFCQLIFGARAKERRLQGAWDCQKEGIILCRNHWTLATGRQKLTISRRAVARLLFLFLGQVLFHSRPHEFLNQRDRKFFVEREADSSARGFISAQLAFVFLQDRSGNIKTDV